MTVNQIAEKFKALNVKEQRELSANYGEFVIFNEDLDRWIALLTEIFGPVAKPDGVKPTREQTQMTQNYGGIFNSQTLFHKDSAEQTLLAMLWPWGDHTHTTLKVASIVKSE